MASRGRASSRIPRSSFATLPVNKPWTALKSLVATCPERNPLPFGKSIWISTRYNDGEKGMIEYDCSSKSIKQIVPYPQGFKPLHHTICKYKEDTIVIIDGPHGSLITFNVTDNSFGKPVDIPRVGYHPSAIAVKKYIHIFHGSKNKKNEYFVYSMQKGTVTTFNDHKCPTQPEHIAVTKGTDDTFYKFGVQNEGSSFFTGALKKKDGSEPIQWTESPQFALKEPFIGSGYVHYESYIITFGGRSNDSVSILDLREESGWKSLDFQCPAAFQYSAAVGNDRKIHLFSYDEDSRMHIAVRLKAFGIELPYDDDEKGSDSDDSEEAINEQIEKDLFHRRRKKDKNEAENRVLLATNDKIMEQNDNLMAFNERMLEHHQDLVASKERMAAEYQNSVKAILGEFEAKQAQNEEEQQQGVQDIMDRFVSMLNEKDEELQGEIAQNREDVEGLQNETAKMKEEINAIKKSIETMNVSISDLNDRVETVEQLQAERDAAMMRITDQVEDLMDVTSEELKLQQRIVKLCNDEAAKTLYQSLSEALSMKFFDAKLVLSSYVDHQIPAESKAAKAGKVGLNIFKKLTEDIPFVGTVVGLVEMAGSAAYDIFVLKAMAQRVIDFETMIGDAAWFSSQLALEMAEMNIGRIKQIKHKYDRQMMSSKEKRKKIEQDVNSTSSELVNNVTNMIGSGRGLTFFEIAMKRPTRKRSASSPSAILARLAMIKPIKNRDKKTPFNNVEREQLKELQDAIGSSDEVEPFKEYFMDFGTTAFIDSIKGSVDMVTDAIISE